MPQQPLSVECPSVIQCKPFGMQRPMGVHVREMALDMPSSAASMMALSTQRCSLAQSFRPALHAM